MQDVGETRRGAAFGAILAAFDTGIGTRIDPDRLAQRARRVSPPRLRVAAVLAALALPMFLLRGQAASARGASEVPPDARPLPHSAAGLDG